ncbi:MAG: fluoride efflux transporter CrcB [Campylobacter sp.]|nr:fluoride efflux transporter CrcB [Campylobacter sp.]
MTKILLLGFGGFVGAVLRYFLSNLINKIFSNYAIANTSFGDFPLGTFCVNAIGSFAIGVLLSLNLSSNLKLFFVSGMLGAFTTFSTFSYENVSLFSSNAFLAILNIFLSVIFCLLFCYFGVILAKNFA